MANVKKVVRESAYSMLMFQCTWEIERTVEFSELTICERAEIVAPEGKMVTLIENGIVRDKKPGFYSGKVILYVSDAFITTPGGLMVCNDVRCTLAPAVCVEDGKLIPEKSVSAAIWGGEITEKKTSDIYVGAAAEVFNGIVVEDSEYTVERARIDLEGFGCNDYSGSDTAVSAYGNSRVEINDCEFNVSGVTRCAVHVGGNSLVTVNNCDILNMSPPSDWLGGFCWQLPFRGTNRLCQLCENGHAVYKNCRLKTNGWGILSIDGVDEHIQLDIIDTTMELSGPRSHGYGAFCIGPSVINVDHSVIDVYGFPLIIMGMEAAGRVNVTNGSLITGRRYGAYIISDDNSIVTFRDSTFDTKDASIVVKGSCTQINIDNCIMKSEAGILLQLVDTEESGMNVTKYFVPVGVKDTYIEGRDLTVADEKDDVILNIENADISGDIMNSSTNIHAEHNSEAGGMGKFHDTMIGHVKFISPTGEEMDAPPPTDGHGPEMMHGPRNLGVTLRNASLTGVISSATQAYRDGLTTISPDNCLEISKVTQTPAPPVNNGVILALEENSCWVVTGRSYLTKLRIKDGARVVGVDGREVRMTVDGDETAVVPGVYTGLIEVTLV